MLSLETETEINNFRSTKVILQNENRNYTIVYED